MLRIRLFSPLAVVFLLISSYAFTQDREWGQYNNVNIVSVGSRIETALQLKLRQPYQSRQLLLGLLQQSRFALQPELIIECLTALSNFTDDPKLTEQTLLFIRQGISLCDTQKHKRNLYNLYNNMASILLDQSQYMEGYKAQLKAAEYAKNNPHAVARVENNMAHPLRILGKRALALEILERCVEAAIRYQDGELWANALQNIACLKEDIGESDYIYYMDSSLRIAEKFKQYDILYRGLVNKALILIKNGKEKAAFVWIQAADTLSQNPAISPRLSAQADEVSGMILTEVGQYKQAARKLQKSLMHTSREKWGSKMYSLSHAYAHQSDFKKAYYTILELLEAQDSAITRNEIIKLGDLELKYRSVEKDKQLAENKLMLTRKDNALKIKNIGMGILAASGVTLSGILLLLQRNYRQKQKNLRAEQRNQELLARLAGEEQERKRISQELHDGIGGILSAAKMNLSSISPASIEQESKYEQGIQLLDEVYNELRQTAHNLSPNVLKQKGLVPTLSGYCKRTAEAQNMDIRLQTLGQLSILDDETALTTYRMVQELLQNVVKHSGASKAMVQLNYQEGLLDITVEDNGKGISGRTQEAGIGLDNIRDRVAALKGHMEIDSRPGEGTTVYINI